MKTIFCILTALLVSGCYFESDSALHNSLRTRSPEVFFSTGQHVFLGKDGSEYVQINVSKGSATIAKKSIKGTSSDYTRTVTQIASTSVDGKKWNPKKDFHLAVNAKSSSYEYFPFLWSKTHISWVTADETGQKISSLRELISIVQGKMTRNDYSTYNLVSANQAAQIIAADRANEAKAKAEADAKKQVSANRSVPRTSHLDIGDGVYVQGFFSDELVTIVRINSGNGTVKVRRSTDSTTKWVDANSIITRGQSTVNDIGRGVATVAIFYCIFAPDSCQG